MLLYDEDDRRYLDFTAGIGVTSTGHCHPRVVEAAQRQVGTLIHAQYTTVMHRPLLTLVERLGEVLPQGLDRMFFANSGSEAIEAALRLSRQATGRPNVVVFHGGFHGRTVAAASMTTSGTKFRSGFSPLMAGVHVAPFPDPGHFGWPVEQATDFALEPTRLHPADADARRPTPRRSSSSRCWARAATCPPTSGSSPDCGNAPTRTASCSSSTKCRPASAGPGSSGAASISMPHPDILVTAKGLASGFPLSAIAASSELMDKAWPGSQGRHVRRQRGGLRGRAWPPST